MMKPEMTNPALHGVQGRQQPPAASGRANPNDKDKNVTGMWVGRIICFWIDFVVNC